MRLVEDMTTQHLKAIFWHTKSLVYIKGMTLKTSNSISCHFYKTTVFCPEEEVSLSILHTQLHLEYGAQLQVHTSWSISQVPPSQVYHHWNSGGCRVSGWLMGKWASWREQNQEEESGSWPWLQSLRCWRKQWSGHKFCLLFEFISKFR